MANQCNLSPNWDCVGGDLSSSLEDSPQACCDRCSQYSGCRAFTHSTYDGAGHWNPTCYLKSGCSSKKQNWVATAGEVTGPPPHTPSPTPPPSCDAGKSVTFPAPTVTAQQQNLTREQQWMQKHWPGYHNGVSFGGLFVIEDWMFQRTHGVHNPSTLHLSQGEAYANHQWSQDLLRGDLKTAYSTMKCHEENYYGDQEIQDLADWGINSVRMPVGYWLFDDIALYPGDKWIHEPTSDYGDYGVNPDGFITGGTKQLSNLVLKLWNRNINVILDMHALPGCSTAHNSYAGIFCEAAAPNFWNGLASDGISGGTRVHRAADGKSWSDVGRKIAIERVVPWIKFINNIAPGAIIAYELVNEPDLQQSDASESQVRSMTLELGRAVSACLGPSVKVGVNNAARNYPTSTIANDYRRSFTDMKSAYITDIHHYYNWGGCNGPDYACVCDSGMPGTSQTGEDGDWNAYISAGVFEDGWRFYIGEWSAAVGDAQRDGHRAGRMWKAQKWNYLNQYLHYKGKADGGKSSFLGDYYWSGRMGYNWDPTPGICHGPTSTSDYVDYKTWDWNFIRLIRLGLAKPLSQLGFTQEGLSGQRNSACGWGTFDFNNTVLV
eukprot:TRINITY_DN9469_c0_g1_i1.p1 TRINITY_DN9469_c0_g1~~TRINITY_DN9469_c0_g1_i1.p1  ORF type:complete len:637 (-),score=76.04 TRINITY_DN9469_c0_g1_i1:75-1889(-)